MNSPGWARPARLTRVGAVRGHAPAAGVEPGENELGRIERAFPRSPGRRQLPML